MEEQWKIDEMEDQLEHIRWEKIQEERIIHDKKVFLNCLSELEDKEDIFYREEESTHTNNKGCQSDIVLDLNLIRDYRKKSLESEKTQDTDLTEKQKMLGGKEFIEWGEELDQEKRKASNLLREYNSLSRENRKTAKGLLRQLFGECGQHVYVEPNFRCEYGYNIHVGENFYASFDCTFIDHCPIYIGDNCIVSPKVGLYTLAYPVEVNRRNQGYEYAKPIHIGNNVWIGSQSVINLGVTIGDNVIISPGSVVFCDIPDNVIVGGNPARVIDYI